MKPVRIRIENARIGDSIRNRGKVKVVETFEGTRRGVPYTNVLLVTTTNQTVREDAGTKILVDRPKYNFNKN